MRWQKVARFAIAVFVVAFAGVVFYTMRERTRAPVASQPPEHQQPAPDVTVISGKGNLESAEGEGGKLKYRVEWQRSVSYKDGRQELQNVKITLPDKDGKTFTVTADAGEAVTPPQKTSADLATAKLTKNVKLTTNDGLEITTPGEATWDGAASMVKVPGQVQFSRGRMKGTGVGATYDRDRDVLWILDQARITIAADEKGGGALDASATTAGLARADDYAKLVGNAAMVSDGRTAQASEITILLDETGQKIQQLQLREQSRITSTGGGAQMMSARHIDMVYLPDGRTLQSSKLMENGVVDLPGPGGAPGRRVAGNTIDISMAPDGTTVTGLNAQDKVQVDIPAEGETPAKTIKSASLRAVGAPDRGLQNATFEGGVDYTETRAANAKLPAIQRHATSLRLIVDTKPGLGPLERADFRGNATFVDGDTTAEAPRALYNIERDQLDLSQPAGDPGKEPTLNDRQLTVQAFNIHLSPSTRKLSADTRVRSLIKPQKQGAGTNGSGKPADAAVQDQTRMPSMLKRDRPVTVTSNRLEYDGKAEATYSGNAFLWQDQSRINADTIVINDRTGDLTARLNVRSTMILQTEDSKTKVKKPAETTVTADLLVYSDAKRLATYTSTPPNLAHLKGVDGDIDGDRIDLYLKESGGELDKAEADGRVAVTVEKMYATGKHLLYTAANDTYVLTGDPVVSIEKSDDGKCTQRQGSVLTFQGAQSGSDRNITLEAIPGLVPTAAKPIDPCPAVLRR